MMLSNYNFNIITKTKILTKVVKLINMFNNSKIVVNIMKQSL